MTNKSSCTLCSTEEACRGACVFREYQCDEDVYKLCVKYMAENEMIPPKTA